MIKHRIEVIMAFVCIFACHISDNLVFLVNTLGPFGFWVFDCLELKAKRKIYMLMFKLRG
jgi:hypothetical protein